MSALKSFPDEELAEFMKMAISESSESDYAEAFTLLYERHKRLVFLRCRMFANAMGLPSSMENDMFNEFFSKFGWASKSKILNFDASKGKSKKPFLSWAMKVLQRVALDMANKYHDRRTQETLLSEEEWDELYLPEEESEPSDHPSTPERRAIDDALANLSPRDKGIVLEYARRKPVNSSLRNSKGTYEEIGAMFNTTGENAKQIISRFRKAALQNRDPQ